MLNIFCFRGLHSKQLAINLFYLQFHIETIFSLTILELLLQTVQIFKYHWRRNVECECMLKVLCLCRWVEMYIKYRVLTNKTRCWQTAFLQTGSNYFPINCNNAKLSAKCILSTKGFSDPLGSWNHSGYNIEYHFFDQFSDHGFSKWWVTLVLPLNLLYLGTPQVINFMCNHLGKKIQITEYLKLIE